MYNVNKFLFSIYKFLVSIYNIEKNIEKYNIKKYFYYFA